MELITTSFYCNHFTLDGTSGTNEVMDNAPVKVDNLMNSKLLKLSLVRNNNEE
jgi:hypothetical protein